MILSPYGKLPGGAYPSESGGSIGPGESYLCPDDPQYNSSGEAGHYYDSPLGATVDAYGRVIAQGPVPSDFDHARAYQYTPSVRGWVATPQGFVQGGYYPQAPAGAQYPATSPPVLGEADPAAIAKARRDQVTFWLSVITTSVVGASALFAVFRSVRGIRQDQLIRQALEKKLL